MWKWIKKLFKIEDKQEAIKFITPKSKMDLSDVKFNMNIKSICYFENLSNKSFYSFSDDDVILLLYSIFIINNPDKQISLEGFLFLMENNDFSNYIFKFFKDSTDFIKDNIVVTTEKKEASDDLKKEVKITDLASLLIIEYGVSAEYVMYKMGLWEINNLFKAIENKSKNDMVDKRFWTYMNIMPHIDTKKCKSPQALLPFDWEKSIIKERKERDLKNNMFAIKNTIGKSIFGDKNNKETKEVNNG